MSYFERSFLAIQKCAVPRSLGFSEEQIRESLRMVNRVVQDKPPLVRFKLLVFFLYIDVLSFFYGGKPFQRLDSEKQYSILWKLFDSNIPLIRKGFWGLNTLARLGVYGQPSVHSSIGYRMRPIPNE